MTKSGRYTMKRFLFVIFFFVVLSVPVLAQDTVKFGGINLQGDTMYLPTSGEFAIGVGTVPVTFLDQLIEVRVEYATIVTDSSDNKKDMYGAGLGIDIVRAVSRLGGQWPIKGIRSSIGFMGLLDMRTRPTIRPAIYLNVLRVDF
jgi:hypothetical protein